MTESVIPIPMQEGPYRMPKSIVDAVSDIQQYAVMESEGVSDIPESFLTLRRYLAYVNIGFIYGLGDNILVWIISPFLYGVLFNLIPIFGHSDLTLFDKIFAFILSKYITIGLLSLMIFLLYRAKGTLSRGCTSALVSGYAAALLSRTFVFLFAYRYLYVVWPDICHWIYNLGTGLERFSSHLHSLSLRITYIATKLADIRHILLITSTYETLFSCIMLLVLAAMYAVIRVVLGRRSSNPYYGRFV